MFEEENKLKLKAMLYAIIKNHNIFIRFIFNVNDILHDDAYISPSVVIKMASEWCIYIYCSCIGHNDSNQPCLRIHDDESIDLTFLP